MRSVSPSQAMCLQAHCESKSPSTRRRRSRVGLRSTSTRVGASRKRRRRCRRGDWFGATRESGSLLRLLLKGRLTKEGGGGILRVEFDSQWVASQHKSKCRHPPKHRDAPVGPKGLQHVSTRTLFSCWYLKFRGHFAETHTCARENSCSRLPDDRVVEVCGAP